MSKTIKITISDQNYQSLLEKAGSQHLQDYIRSILFPSQESSITPEIAIAKALEKYQKGDRFTIHDIFGNEWHMAHGYAGIFGRRFYSLVKEKYSDKIKFTNTNKSRHAVYEIL